MQDVVDHRRRLQDFKKGFVPSAGVASGGFLFWVNVDFTVANGALQT
jgi:hypothetical protein